MSRLAAVRRRARDRQLASNARAGVWARGQVRKERWTYVRRHWRHYAVFLLVGAALVGGLAPFMPAGFFRGLVVGGAATAMVAFLVGFTMLVTGTGHRSMGALAEVWTADELRPLRSSGWKLVNHFGLRPGDIDHLLIGPSGVVVVETKWSSDDWRLGVADQRLRQALGSLKASARSVRLWTKADRRGVPVHAVLFLWSADTGTPLPPTPVEIEGVTVVRGVAAARAWRQQLAAASVTPPETVAEIAAQVIAQVARRDDHEARHHPVPPSINEIYWTGAGCVLAMVAGVLALAAPLSQGRLWLDLPVGLAAVALGLVLRRFRWTRLPADAWLAAVVGMGVISVAAVLVFG